jgi:hypothetical protein
MKNLTPVGIALVSVGLLLPACRGQDSPNIGETGESTRAIARASKDQTSLELPTEITYPQLYVGQDGETHFREAKVSLTQVAASPPAQPFAQSTLQPATTIRHAVFQPHWGVYDRDHNILHSASAARFVSIRQGTMWIRASDGETRQFRAGDVVEVLDVAPSKGHTTWVGDDPVIALFSNHP